jgi:hypothetical protein
MHGHNSYRSFILEPNENSSTETPLSNTYNQIQNSKHDDGHDDAEDALKCYDISGPI